MPRRLSALTAAAALAVAPCLLTGCEAEDDVNAVVTPPVVEGGSDIDMHADGDLHDHDADAVLDGGGTDDPAVERTTEELDDEI